MELDVAISGEVFVKLNKILEFIEKFGVASFEIGLI